MDFQKYKHGGLLADRYRQEQALSVGLYGIVTLARDTRDGGLVAVKYITADPHREGGKEPTPEGGKPDKNFAVINGHHGSDLDSALSSSSSLISSPEVSRLRALLEAEAKHEISLLERISHPNVIRLCDHFGPYIIMEYCHRGDLYEAIRSGEGPQATRDIVGVMLQLMDAVAHVHGLGIYHRDIKPENILITQDWTIKLLDWGLGTTTRMLHEFGVGSERYMAPELFDRENLEEYDAAKVDIWLLGVCLVNIVFRRNPFRAANASDKLFVLFSASREFLFDMFLLMLYDMFGVLRHLLTLDPENRDLDAMCSELHRAVEFTIDCEMDEASDEYEVPQLPPSVLPPAPPPKQTPPAHTLPVHTPVAIPTKTSPQAYNLQDHFTPQSVLTRYMDKLVAQRVTPDKPRGWRRRRRPRQNNYPKPPREHNPRSHSMRKISRKELYLLLVNATAPPTGKYIPPHVRGRAAPVVAPVAAARVRLPPPALRMRLPPPTARARLPLFHAFLPPARAQLPPPSDLDGVFLLEDDSIADELLRMQLERGRPKARSPPYDDRRQLAGAVYRPPHRKTRLGTAAAASATAPAAAAAAPPRPSTGLYIPPFRRGSHSRPPAPAAASQMLRLPVHSMAVPATPVPPVTASTAMGRFASPRADQTVLALAPTGSAAQQWYEMDDEPLAFEAVVQQWRRYGA